MIEAADFVPDWINPDNSDYRIFIHKGQLHLISLDKMSEETKSLKNSLSILFSNQSQTIPDVDSHLKEIISHYPSKIYSDFHHCILCFILIYLFSSLLFNS